MHNSEICHKILAIGSGNWALRGICISHNDLSVLFFLHANVLQRCNINFAAQNIPFLTGCMHLLHTCQSNSLFAHPLVGCIGQNMPGVDFIDRYYSAPLALLSYYLRSHWPKITGHHGDLWWKYSSPVSQVWGRGRNKVITYAEDVNARFNAKIVVIKLQWEGKGIYCHDMQQVFLELSIWEYYWLEIVTNTYMQTSVSCRRNEKPWII